MKKLTVVFFCSLLFGTMQTSMAQTKFRKVLGNSGYDYGNSVHQTFDKGYIIGGSTTSIGNGNSDMYLLKTDSLGMPQLQKTFGGINIDRGSSVIQTADSGYVLVGYTNSLGAGGYDVYAVRLDSLYNLVWEKTYGGSDWDFGASVKQTSDGGFIIGGSTYSYGAGDEDYYLIKTNAAGDTLWTKTYGGINEDEATAAIPTSDGGYVITGCSKSQGDPNGDFYTIKTDANGDTLWTYKYGGSQFDKANDVIESAAGGYLVVGETKSYGMGDSDGLVIKIDASGNYVLNYLMGDVAYDNLYSITEKADGKIGMAGITYNYGSLNGDVFEHIVRADFSFFNATTFGTLQEDIGYSIAPTADNAFVLCGTTTGFNNQLEDIYLIKTDTNGLSGFTGSENNIVLSGITEHNTHTSLAIYPNPANDQVVLNFPSDFRNENTVFQLFDVLGKEYMNFQLDSSVPFYFSTAALPDGIYSIQLTQAHTRSTAQLVVQH